MYKQVVKVQISRVADPHSFHPDRIQHFRLNTDPDRDPIRIQGFDDQKLKKKKITAEKKKFGIKNYNLPIPKPPKEHPSY
jgi:hypothetical protein